jgi:hypothetical protein
MEIERSGPLSSGQQLFWFYSHETFRRDWGRSPLIQYDLRLPPGTTMMDLRGALDECARRFEALRTVYAKREASRPIQMVLRSHSPRIIESFTDDASSFDILSEPSFHCRVVLDGTVVVEAQLVANQIDLDGNSIAMVSQVVYDFIEAGGVDSADRPPAASPHPIDHAVREQSDAAWHSRSRKGIAWFRRTRSEAVRNFLPFAVSEPDRRRIHYSEIHDPQLLRRVARLAKQCRVSIPTVFHTAIGLVLSQWLDIGAVLTSTAVSNRWIPNLQNSVGRIASEVDWVFKPGDDATAAQLLKRVHMELLQAYTFGWRDFGECVMEAVRENCEYGSRLAKPVFIEYYNYLQENTALHHTILERDDFASTEAGMSNRLRIDIEPRWPGVRFLLSTEDSIASPETCRALAEGILAVIESVCANPETGIGELGSKHAVAPFDSGPPGNWLWWRGSRYDRSRMRSTIMGCDGVQDVEFAIAPDGQNGLAALLEGADIDLPAVHRDLLRAATHDPLLCVPTLYALVDGRAGDVPMSSDPMVLSRSANVTRTFAPHLDRAPEGEPDARTEALLAAFQRCNPGRDPDASRSYAELEGEYLMIPAMVDELHRVGYRGAHPEDFLGVTPLSVIARSLRAD